MSSTRAAGCAGPGRRGLHPRRPGLGSQPANDDPSTGVALEPQHCFNNQRGRGGQNIRLTHAHSNVREVLVTAG